MERYRNELEQWMDSEWMGQAGSAERKLERIHLFSAENLARVCRGKQMVRSDGRGSWPQLLQQGLGERQLTTRREDPVARALEAQRLGIGTHLAAFGAKG